MAAESVVAPHLAERSRLIDLIRAHHEQLRALGVAHLWLFGSTARGEARPASDVEIPIGVVPKLRFRLLDLAEVRLPLCDLLRHDVGVAIRHDLRPLFRATIPDDLVDVL